MSDLLHLLLILACLLGSFFFSGMETGVLSIHRFRLRHYVRQGVRSAKLLQSFLDRSDYFLGTTLLGNNICLVVSSVAATAYAERVLGARGEWVSAPVMTLLILVYCEYLPKAWFRSRPFFRTLPFAALMWRVQQILSPLSIFLVWVTGLVAPGKKSTFGRPVPFVTREDLRLLAKESEQHGALTPRERFMIQRVFELSAKSAADIMIPRDRMTAVDRSSSVADCIRTFRESRFTRLPVMDPVSGDCAGVINAMHVLAVDGLDIARPVADFMRPPLLIDAKMPADEIFPVMRRRKHPLCIVRDAEGKVLGLVTTEDILEEVVGQLD